VVCAWEGYIEIARVVAAAFWIVYNGCAYYASGPSLEKNVQHAVILESLVQLKARGITLVEMGQTDGATEKERNIAKFKRGFGGSERPYMVIRRCAL
jgi:lipid II:glycine glycyltransferase (peptidoglycan interpeptide bridge formation enzyme)